MSNLRLELAFLIPEDKKLSVDMVVLTVARSLEAITTETLKQMKKGGVRFESLQDLTDFDLRLQQLKRDWNAEQKAKQRKQLKEGK
jgi:hypothetical protein